MTKKNRIATVRYVPDEKRSKKDRKEANALQRGSWYGLNPVTRIIPNKKAYDRNRTKRTMCHDMALA